MRITIDTMTDTDETIRSAIGFLIHLRPALASEVPEGTKPCAGAECGSTDPKFHSVQCAAEHERAVSGNVVNFPVPPPPSTHADTAATVTAPPSAVPAATAAAVGNVVSVASPSSSGFTLTQVFEYDSAGMPWDARIHQKKKSKKQDGTWKLQKGIDPAIVQNVVSEISARKIATPQSPSQGSGALIAPPANAVPLLPPGAVPPPPPVAQPVTLPQGQNSVPLPPQPGQPTAPVLYPQDGAAAGAVPLPPVSANGNTGVSYRSIIDKLTAATREGKIPPAKIAELVQSCGCPNLQHLNSMPGIFADLDGKIDLAIAGLL